MVRKIRGMAVVTAALLGGFAARANVVGSGFTYQGELKQDGHPATGPVNLLFTLWRSSTSTLPADQIGSPQAVNGVMLDNGLFTVELSANGEFGASPFTGEERWLQVSVNGTLLSPRQELTGTPFALGLRPGAAVRGDAAGAGILSVSNANSTGIGLLCQALTSGGAGTPVAVRGETNAPGGYSGYFLGGRNYFEGNVGIGVPSPNSKLEVGGSMNVHGGVIQKGGPPITTTTDLGLYSVAPGWMRFVTSGSPIQFFTNLINGTAGSPPANSAAMTIAQNGRVGIGIMSPAATLHVNGTTRTNVLEITGGSDIAEPFNVSADDEIQPGMVVSIDPNRVGELRLSRRTYDPAVAGVISGANGVEVGLTLTQTGSAADGKHPVALTGRVWCWCDASTAPIHAGDLLTTSATPGHAMKVLDRERAGGAVIGKAMSSLESGQGLVLVLVNLQ